jgi:hypothetical protein
MSKFIAYSLTFVLLPFVLVGFAAGVVWCSLRAGWRIADGLAQWISEA